MVVIPEDIKNQLKAPWGELHQTDYLNSIKSEKIISVGDVSTLNCINNGIKPYIAVFDFRFMRKELEEEKKKILNTAFPRTIKIKNEPGTISIEFVELAKKLMRNGGAVLVEGEEDLTALVFMAFNTNFYIIYGQPKEGMVVVKPINLETKTKAGRILAELGLL